MTRLIWDEHGTEAALRHLSLFERRLHRPRPVLSEGVADYLRGRQARRFATAGDGTWPPLSPQTIRRKGSARPLVDSGALRSSLTRKRARGSRATVLGDTLTFGTTLYYARFVARRRPLFRTTAADVRSIAERVVDWLTEPFRL